MARKTTTKAKTSKAKTSKAKPAVPQERFNKAAEASSIAETGRLNMTTLAQNLLDALTRMGPITPLCLPQCRKLTEPPFVEHAPGCEYAALVNRVTEALA